MKFIRSFITVLVVAVLFAPFAARKSHHNVDYDHNWIMKDLNLTEKQQEKIREMHKKNIKDRKEHWIKVKNLRNKMKEEIASDKPDVDKLKTYAVEMSRHIAEVTQRRIDNLIELKKVLNKEQFQKILNHEWHGKDGMHRRGKHIPND